MHYLYHTQMSVPDLGPLNQVADAVANNDTAALPESIRPPRDLPDGCRLGLLAGNMDGGTLQILKILNFRERIHAKDAGNYCAGTPYALVFRPGPWQVKKALLPLIERLPGFHVSLFALDKVTDKFVAPRRSHSSQWAPADEELLAGIQYINENVPECESQNQQLYWVLCNIKEDCGSPIRGWPEAKVRVMAQNRPVRSWKRTFPFIRTLPSQPLPMS